jgi:hypothetical protein
MTPSALALSPDGKRLFVACSDGNVAAVADVSDPVSRVEGFIPAGWYPTAVRVLPSGTLVVVNAKGVRSYPNPDGPNPGKRVEPVNAGVRDPEYVAYMQTGTASWIAPFSDPQLADWTKKALAFSAYRDAKLDVTSTFPPQIQHVLYIEKENRTYDQVLGDMKEGNGDASLVLFGENVTPNLHKIAREFVLLDNFYVNADVSADGNNWSTAAIAPDWVQKLWPTPAATVCTISKSRIRPRFRRRATSGATPLWRALRCAITASWWKISGRLRPWAAIRSKRSTIRCCRSSPTGRIAAST